MYLCLLFWTSSSAFGSRKLLTLWILLTRIILIHRIKWYFIIPSFSTILIFEFINIIRPYILRKGIRLLSISSFSSFLRANFTTSWSTTPFTIIIIFRIGFLGHKRKHSLLINSWITFRLRVRFWLWGECTVILMSSKFISKLMMRITERILPSFLIVLILLIHLLLYWFLLL